MTSRPAPTWGELVGQPDRCLLCRSGGPGLAATGGGAVLCRPCLPRAHAWGIWADGLVLVRDLGPSDASPASDRHPDPLPGQLSLLPEES